MLLSWSLQQLPPTLCNSPSTAAVAHFVTLHSTLIHLIVVVLSICSCTVQWMSVLSTVGSSLHRYRSEAEELVLDHFKEVARRRYSTDRFRPGNCIRLFLLTFGLTVVCLFVYYFAIAQQCSDQLAFKRWGDPECSVFYGPDAFTGTTSAEEGQLVADLAVLPVKNVIAHARTTDSLRFLPYPDQCDDSGDAERYERDVAGMEVNIAVDNAEAATVVAIAATVYFKPKFLVALNGLYVPLAVGPRIRNGVTGQVRAYNMPRSAPANWSYSGNMTAIDAAAIYQTFIAQGQLYTVVATMLQSACIQFTSSEHLQQCSGCDKLSSSIALPLVATNAIIAFQLLLALSVFCVHRWYPAERHQEKQERCELQLASTSIWKGPSTEAEADSSSYYVSLSHG